MKRNALFASVLVLAACDEEPTLTPQPAPVVREQASAPALIETAMVAMGALGPAASEATPAALEPTPVAPEEMAPVTIDTSASIESIVARGAFASDTDRERFETEVLPSARAFLSYWTKLGLRLPHQPARIFVSAPPETSATVALPQLYGESIFDDLSALEAEVASAPSNRAAIERIDTFTCARPPLHRGFLEELEKYADSTEVGPAEIAGALREEHAELLGPDGTFSFRTDNGEFELPLRRNCSYTLLGYSTSPARAHPFLERDVVNHELGHALHYGLWLATAPLGERLSSAANEAIADILAHVFDGDPCHGKVLDERGATVGCRRRMDTYGLSVSDAFWRFGRGDHETGQSLRQLIWTLRDEVPEAELGQAIVAGIAAVQVALNQIDAEALANVPVFDDEILATRYRFMREYDASEAFFHAVCARLQSEPAACAEHAQRIGDPRVAMRAAFLANSPTAIGQSGVTLGDGRRVSFELQGALIASMTVSLPDGSQQIYPGDADLGIPQVDRESDSGRVTLWFSEIPGAERPGAELGWTSDGELITR